MSIMEEKLVIEELRQGKELASRLKNNLKRPSSQEINRFLISEILCSYEKAISLLNFGGSPAGQSEGPRSEGYFDVDSKNVFKKRKIAEKKTEQVKVCVGGRSLDDGYCWRKYGQKVILGSKNPRGYYRCTHRFTQGCLAVKQVQRSDTDPSVFEVKYLGSHNCTANTNRMFEGDKVTEEKQLITEKLEERKPTKSEEMMLSLDDLENKKAIFPTFSFSNAELENGGEKSDIFPENLMENLSPGTSGSGITCELMSAPTSVANSPMGDTYFSSLDNIFDLDSNFLLDGYLELVS